MFWAFDSASLTDTSMCATNFVDGFMRAIILKKNWIHIRLGQCVTNVWFSYFC